mmetsp:Transcript_79193/g.206631  ORF Transcript_79193/g.206631 Transcript_79193/m.206631 type:complete len:100 (-) Transcript_79193:147-446(-)
MPEAGNWRSRPGAQPTGLSPEARTWRQGESKLPEVPEEPEEELLPAPVRLLAAPAKILQRAPAKEKEPALDVAATKSESGSPPQGRPAEQASAVPAADE